MISNGKYCGGSGGYKHGRCELLFHFHDGNLDGDLYINTKHISINKANDIEYLHELFDIIKSHVDKLSISPVTDTCETAIKNKDDTFFITITSAFSGKPNISFIGTSHILSPSGQCVSVSNITMDDLCNAIHVLTLAKI